MIDDRHAGAQLAHVLDDVRGEKDDAVLPDLAEQVEEPHALGGVEPGRRLVHDQQLGVAEQRHGDAKALPHAPRVAAQLLLAHVPQVRLPEQRLDDFLAFPALGDALEQREVIEQLLRAHLRIDAELLRQIAERLADFVLLPQHVDARPGGSLPSSGSWSVAMMRISVDLPAPLGPSSPYMPAGMVRLTSLRAWTPFG